MIYIYFFVIAFISSFFGQGGGSLFTPFQIMFGINAHTSGAVSQFLIFFLSLSSATVFIKNKVVNWKLIGILIIFLVPFSFLGGRLSIYFSEFLLSILLSILLIISGFSLLFKINININNKKSGFKIYYQNEIFYINFYTLLIISSLIGFLSGLLGIGGGILITPALIIILNIPPKIALGSNAAVIGFVAFSGFLGHIFAKINFPYFESFKLAIIVIIAANIGPRLGMKLKTEKIKKYYGFFLLSISIILILNIINF